MKQIDQRKKIDVVLMTLFDDLDSDEIDGKSLYYYWC